MAIMRQHHVFSIISLLVSTAHARFIYNTNSVVLSGLKALPNGNNQNVEVLNLLSSNLSELASKDFISHNFHNLQKVILRNDHIEVIQPKAFEGMSQMIQLDLYGNRLLTFHIHTFKGLGLLRNLNLGSNRILYVDEASFEPLHSLQTLDLSRNYITTFASSFIKRKRMLQELNLEGNPIILKKYGPILESDSLNNLFLQSCNLENLPSEAFYKLPKLELLDLSRNQLKVLPAGLLKNQQHLAYLDISYNSITHVTIDIFHKPVHLDEFYCDDNPLEDDRNCGKLLSEMKRQDARLKEDKVSSSGLVNHKREQLPRVFTNLVEENPQKYVKKTRRLRADDLTSTTSFLSLTNVIVITCIAWIVVILVIVLIYQLVDFARHGDKRTSASQHRYQWM